MTHAFGSRSLSRSQHVDPVLMEVAADALAHCPVDFGLAEEQSRTYAEQAEKVRLGVSKTMASKHMIPKGGRYSVALDLVPYVNDVFNWGDGQWKVGSVYVFYEIAVAMRAAAIRRGVKLRWGGVWDRSLNELPDNVEGMRKAVEAYKARHAGSDFLDGPHFELVH